MSEIASNERVLRSLDCRAARRCARIGWSTVRSPRPPRRHPRECAVNDPSPPPPRRHAFSRRAASFGVGLVTRRGRLGLLAVAARDRRLRGRRPRPAPSRSRDVYAGSPFKNARPGVAYVGDAACARCHREIAEAYRSHPMGRSLAPVADTKDGPPTSAATGLPIEDKGVQYTIEHRDGTRVPQGDATRRGRDFACRDRG